MEARKQNHWPIREVLDPVIFCVKGEGSEHEQEFHHD